VIERFLATPASRLALAFGLHALIDSLAVLLGQVGASVDAKRPTSPGKASIQSVRRFDAPRGHQSWTDPSDLENLGTGSGRLDRTGGP